MIGGIWVKRVPAAPGETGSTLGFKAFDSHGTAGFVIAGHEGKTLGATIAQPGNGGTVGSVTGIIPGFDRYHDYAFVTPNAGHTVDPIIYAQEVGLNYPINQKVHDSAQLPGSQIVKSGIGSQVTVGKIISISSGLVITNLNPVGGDSGSPVFKPLVDGTANVYGIITDAAGGGIYLTWDNMKAGLNLTG